MCETLNRTDLVPKQFRGRVPGILSFISGIAYDTGQFIAGPIYEYNPRLSFLIAFLFIGVELGATFKLKEGNSSTK